VLTGIRHGCSLDDAGLLLQQNGKRHLRSAEQMCALFRDLPEAIAEPESRLSGSTRINGGWGRKNLASGTSIPYIDANAFLNTGTAAKPNYAPANYTFGNAARSYVNGLRTGGLQRGYEYSTDLQHCREVALHVGGEHVQSGQPYGLRRPKHSGGSAEFGTITSQANQPRTAQFSGRLEF
jgi:hypothetical protein